MLMMGSPHSPPMKKAIAVLKNTKEMSSIMLHKIASNSCTVMDAFPPEGQDKDLVDIELTVDPLPLQRSLELTWNLQSDMFTFRVSREKKSFTTRENLSTANGLYDSLGFVSTCHNQRKGLSQGGVCQAS